MTTDTKHIHIEPESEIGRLLDEAADRPVILEKDGELYRLTKEETAKPHLPARTVVTQEDDEAFLSAAGGWANVDIDAFLETIYESRKSSRPPVEL